MNGSTFLQVYFYNHSNINICNDRSCQIRFCPNTTEPFFPPTSGKWDTPSCDRHTSDKFHVHTGKSYSLDDPYKQDSKSTKYNSVIILTLSPRLPDRIIYSAMRIRLATFSSVLAHVSRVVSSRKNITIEFENALLHEVFKYNNNISDVNENEMLLK